MLFRRLVGACVLCAAAVVQATTAYFPDYYTEPGIRQDKSYDSVADYEDIDPFGGTVKLHHVDLFLPGDGGADITIERSYMPREPRTAAAMNPESWGAVGPCIWDAYGAIRAA